MFGLTEFQALLKGGTVSHQQEEEDQVMISGESSVQPSPPPPDSYLVTAQLEGSTLSRAQYNTVCSLTSSLLRVRTGDLEYDGHTFNPLTLHWHTSTDPRASSSLSLCSEMAQQGIRQINIDNYREFVIPHLDVSNRIVCYEIYTNML